LLFLEPRFLFLTRFHLLLFAAPALVPRAAPVPVPLSC
jgi:hypothetical protein